MADDGTRRRSSEHDLRRMIFDGKSTGWKRRLRRAHLGSPQRRRWLGDGVRLGGSMADSGARWRRGYGRSAVALVQDKEAAGTGSLFKRSEELGVHGNDVGQGERRLPGGDGGVLGVDELR